MHRNYPAISRSAEAAPHSMAREDVESISAVATLLDAKQVAKLLHVSESWVREHSNGKEPRLPAMKLGQGKTALVRFHMSDIEDFIQSQRELARSRTLAHSRW